MSVFFDALKRSVTVLQYCYIIILFRKYHRKTIYSYFVKNKIAVKKYKLHSVPASNNQYTEHLVVLFQI